MTPPPNGCETCSLESRADRRGDALITIACAHGPEFLNRCTVCGGFWLETLRFEKWLSRTEVVEMFGEPGDSFEGQFRLIEVLTLWDQLGRNQTLYVAQPWSADSLAIVVTGDVDDTMPVVRHGIAYDYFLEASIIREFIEDYSVSAAQHPTMRDIAERLVRYAEDDA